MFYTIIYLDLNIWNSKLYFHLFRRINSTLNCVLFIYFYEIDYMKIIIKIIIKI